MRPVSDLPRGDPGGGAPPVSPARLRVPGVDELDVGVLGATAGAHALRIPDAPVPVRLLHRLRATLERPLCPPAVGVLVAVRTAGGGLDDARLDFVEGLAAPVAASSSTASPAGPVAPAPRGAAPPPPGPPDVQRRAWVRVPAMVPLTLRAVIADRDWGAGWTVDLSAGGARIAGVDAGLPGDPLRGVFELPGLVEPLRTHVRVTRVLPDGSRAIRLESIDPRDRERLAEYVAARQRELLRARRVHR